MAAVMGKLRQSGTVEIDLPYPAVAERDLRAAGIERRRRSRSGHDPMCERSDRAHDADVTVLINDQRAVGREFRIDSRNARVDVSPRCSVTDVNHPCGI